MGDAKNVRIAILNELPKANNHPCERPHLPVDGFTLSCSSRRRGRGALTDRASISNSVSGDRRRRSKAIMY